MMPDVATAINDKLMFKSKFFPWFLNKLFWFNNYFLKFLYWISQVLLYNRILIKVFLQDTKDLKHIKSFYLFSVFFIRLESERDNFFLFHFVFLVLIFQWLNFVKFFQVNNHSMGKTTATLTFWKCIIKTLH